MALGIGGKKRRKKRRAGGRPVAVAPPLQPFVQSNGSDPPDVDDGLYNFLSPPLLPTGVGPPAGHQGLPHPHEYAAGPSFQGTGFLPPTAAPLLAASAKPAWFQSGHDVGDLLKEAEGLDWMLDAGGCEEAAGDDGYRAEGGAAPLAPSASSSSFNSSSSSSSPPAPAMHIKAEPSYGAPEPSYGPPEPSYGAPEPFYGVCEPYSSEDVYSMMPGPPMLPLAAALGGMGADGAPLPRAPPRAEDTAAMVQSLARHAGMTVEEYLRASLQAIAPAAGAAAAALALSQVGG